MHAIIRQGKGKYYISAVFGYYHDVHSKNTYKRARERFHTAYYVVWDEEKKHLIKWFAMQPQIRALIPQILIIDTDEKDWIWDEETNMGGVDFLTRKFADELIKTGEVPLDILEKCLAVDNCFEFNPYPEIHSAKDIADLMEITGAFHDAEIKEMKVLEDGSLYVLFDGIWGCALEIWFWGEVEYDTASRNPELYDPYWNGGSVIIHDGFIYLVDEYDIKYEEITDEYCWFKARNMKYHIIPD